MNIRQRQRISLDNFGRRSRAAGVVASLCLCVSAHAQAPNSTLRPPTGAGAPPTATSNLGKPTPIAIPGNLSTPVPTTTPAPTTNATKKIGGAIATGGATATLNANANANASAAVKYTKNPALKARALPGKIVDNSKKLQAAITMLQEQEKQEREAQAKQDAKEAAALAATQAFLAKFSNMTPAATLSLAAPRGGYGGANLSVNNIAFINFDRGAAVFNSNGYASCRFTATDDGAYLADFLVEADKSAFASATMSIPTANLGNVQPKFDGVQTTLSAGANHVLISKNFQRGENVTATFAAGEGVAFVLCEVSRLK